MRFGLLIFAAQSALIGSVSAVPTAPQPSRSPCNDPAIKVIDAIFRIYPQSASKICTKILTRGPAPTSVVTNTAKATAFATVTSGVTTSTQTSGIATVSSTGTQRITSGTTAIVTVTNTQVQVSTFTTTSTATTTSVLTTTTSSTTTIYSNVLNPPPTAAANAKRAVQLSQAVPDCPKAFANIALDIAKTACNCYLPPVSTYVSTIQVSSTSTSTVTVPSISITVVPSSTTTAVVVVTAYAVSDSTSTTTTTVVSTSSTTISTSTTVTSTSTSFVAAATARVTTTYTKNFEQNTAPAYVYNEYTDYIQVDNHPPVGIDQCATLCAQRSYCRFYDYYKSDPAFRNQGDDSAWCIIDNAAYQGQYAQAVPFAKYAIGYTRV